MSAVIQYCKVNMGFCSNVWGEDVRDKFQFIAFQFTYQPWTLFFLIERLLILGSTGSSLLQGLFSSDSERGAILLVAVHGLHIAVASLVAEHGLLAHRLQELWHAGSVLVVHGLSCSVVYGVFPDKGWNPCLQHWQADCLLLSWATRETLNLLFELKNSLQSFGCRYVFEKD